MEFNIQTVSTITLLRYFICTTPTSSVVFSLFDFSNQHFVAIFFVKLRAGQISYFFFNKIYIICSENLWLQYCKSIMF